MITLIEALNFQCLRYIRQPLGPFHVLVGPNASGKTTLLDVVAFLGDVVSNGPEAAVRARSQNFQDLTWGRFGDHFDLAIEARIPSFLREQYAIQKLENVRYEVSLGLTEESREIVVRTEKVLLLPQAPPPPRDERTLFPEDRPPPGTVSVSVEPYSGKRTVLSRTARGTANYREERYGRAKGGFTLPLALGPRKSALGNLPEDESKFPVSTWLKGFLSEGIQQFVLNSALLRQASPPGLGRGFKPDGTNLPWMVEDLKQRNPERFRLWIQHLQTSLGDLRDIRTVEHPDTRYRYLVLCYEGGLEIPSWVASDGTLRLLALTLPAYADGFRGLYLIEEPENGIHPTAVETVYQSLSSVYDAQVLLATHSTVILSLVKPDQVLCFSGKPVRRDLWPLKRPSRPSVRSGRAS
jgi:predicted ATPase